jgi:hypothetical protein
MPVSDEKKKEWKILHWPNFKAVPGNGHVQTIAQPYRGYIFPTVGGYEKFDWTKRLPKVDYKDQGKPVYYPFIYSEGAHKESWGIESDDDPNDPDLQDDTGLDESNPFSKKNLFETYGWFRPPKDKYPDKKWIFKWPNFIIAPKIFRNAVLTDTAFLDKNHITCGGANLTCTFDQFLLYGLPTSSLRDMEINDETVKAMEVDATKFVGGKVLIINFTTYTLPGIIVGLEYLSYNNMLGAFNSGPPIHNVNTGSLNLDISAVNRAIKKFIKYKHVLIHFLRPTDLETTDPSHAAGVALINQALKDENSWVVEQLNNMMSQLTNFELRIYETHNFQPTQIPVSDIQNIIKDFFKEEK